MRTRIHQINFSEWFPPNDVVAVVVARLCILRQDYLLELRGMVTRGGIDGQGFPQLDENSSEWRRIYFFRNSLRTLFEIRRTVEGLFHTKERKEALSREATDLQEAFRELRERLSIAAELVKDLRHDVGGHVDHGAVQKALATMPIGSGGFYQRGEILGKTHYRFTSELVISMIVPGVVDDKLIEELEKILGRTSKLIQVVGNIDKVFRAFTQGRRLYCP